MDIRKAGQKVFMCIVVVLSNGSSARLISELIVTGSEVLLQDWDGEVYRCLSHHGLFQ